MYNPSFWVIVFVDGQCLYLPTIIKPFQETLQTYGYYDVQLSKGHILLGLNTNIYKTTNNIDFENEKDPSNQLEWIENKLINATKFGNKVHMIGHIPPGGIILLKLYMCLV